MGLIIGVAVGAFIVGWVALERPQWIKDAAEELKKFFTGAKDDPPAANT